MKARVDNLPFEEYISALEAGRFDLYLGEVALTADFDLSALLASDGALNYGRWQDEQTDQLLAALAAAPWTAGRRPLPPCTPIWGSGSRWCRCALKTTPF